MIMWIECVIFLYVSKCLILIISSFSTWFDALLCVFNINIIYHTININRFKMKIVYICVRSQLKWSYRPHSAGPVGLVMFNRQLIKYHMGRV